MGKNRNNNNNKRGTNPNKTDWQISVDMELEDELELYRAQVELMGQQIDILLNRLEQYEDENDSLRDWQKRATKAVMDICNNLLWSNNMVDEIEASSAEDAEYTEYSASYANVDSSFYPEEDCSDFVQDYDEDEIEIVDYERDDRFLAYSEEENPYRYR